MNKSTEIGVLKTKLSVLQAALSEFEAEAFRLRREGCNDPELAEVYQQYDTIMGNALQSLAQD
jgi:hypothetical protein